MTKAIILAAGLGSRLRPLTYNKPKCLIELFGETLLSRQLRVLEGCGVDDVLVVGGYLADEIIKLGLIIVLNNAL